MDNKEYYADLRRNKKKLVADLAAGKHPGQPEPELVWNEENDEHEKQPVAVYITSVRNRQAMTTSGSVCLATIDNAAIRITDGTHQVSNAEEIKAYIKRQEDNKRAMQQDSLREKKQFEITVPRA